MRSRSRSNPAGMVLPEPLKARQRFVAAGLRLRGVLARARRANALLRFRHEPQERCAQQTRRPSPSSYSETKERSRYRLAALLALNVLKISSRKRRSRTPHRSRHLRNTASNRREQRRER
jgi:hypothetical protein